MKNRGTIFIALLLLGVTCTSCSTDDEESMDITAPKVSILSPEGNQTYVGDWGGAWPEGDKVNLKASGVDETNIASMKLTVTNSIGTVVLEITVNSTTDTQTELVISETFTPIDTGTYSVIFTATDVHGNVEISVPRTFLVK